MLSVYVFSLVLGGSFLLVSLLGDIFDTGTDVDAAPDVDLDADVDAGDAVEPEDAARSPAATKIFSIRGLIYALFGFGAVGTAMTLLGQTGFVVTLVSALVGGILAGSMVTMLFNWIAATGVSNRSDDRGFVGLRGIVTLPVGEGSAGTVAVERGGRRITLRALPWSGVEGDSSTWRDVVVMEMDQGVAHVAPIEEDLALEP